MPSIEIKEGFILLVLKVKANSSQTEIKSIDPDFIYISVAAVADKEKANKALIRFVAKLFGIPKTSVSILSGKHSSTKVVQIKERMELAEIQSRLLKN